MPRRLQIGSLHPLRNKRRVRASNSALRATIALTSYEVRSDARFPTKLEVNSQSLEEAMHQEKTGSCHSAHFDRMKTIGTDLVVLTLTLCAALPANAIDGQFIAHNTPPLCGFGEEPGD